MWLNLLDTLSTLAHGINKSQMLMQSQLTLLVSTPRLQMTPIALHLLLPLLLLLLLERSSDSI